MKGEGHIGADGLMRALIYDAPRDFAVREVPTPRAGAGEVVVDVTLAGVCGTDLHLHAGGFFAEFPLTPGHESVGVVSEVGVGVEHLTPGQRVAVDNASACGHCPECDTPLVLVDLLGEEVVSTP